jgi:putative MATE family efflux protein
MTDQEPAAETTGSPALTQGVKLLLGDPKKAIIKLSIPMILAMGLTSLYNIVDRIWVSGVGPNGLSATGYYFPLMMLAMAFTTGLGVGGGSAVSRLIGARQPEKASSVAMHTLVIGLLIALVFTIPFLIFAPQIFSAMGAGDALADTVSYGTIMFAGTIFLFFTQIANALLRSEGSATRAMIAIAAGAALNIGLDPLFIYGLGLGVAGAAWATVLSMALSSFPLVFWLFIEKKNYLRFHLKGFRFRREILADISTIGIPAVIMQGSMSVMMFLLTVILAVIGQDKAVAVFNAGWSVVMLAILPLIGIATAVTSVAAAAYGAGRFDRLRVVHLYSFKLGLIIELVIALLTAVGAPLVAGVFSWSPKTAHLAPEITGFLRIIWIFYPAVAGGMLSSALFQGVRKGFYSLFITLLRTIVLSVVFAYLLGITFGLGEQGVYIGMIVATWISSITAFVWAGLYIRKLNAVPVPALAG